MAVNGYHFCDKAEKWIAYEVCNKRLEEGTCIVKKGKCKPKRQNKLTEKDRARRVEWGRILAKKRKEDKNVDVDTSVHCHDAPGRDLMP